MEGEKTTQEIITTSTFDGCRHYESWNIQNAQPELQVLAWNFSLRSDHPDFGFFCSRECKKCSGCNDEFNFLHYTSKNKAYCVKCYLNCYCQVIRDNSIFRVVIKKTGRTLIELS